MSLFTAIVSILQAPAEELPFSHGSSQELAGTWIAKPAPASAGLAVGTSATCRRLPPLLLLLLLLLLLALLLLLLPLSQLLLVLVLVLLYESRCIAGV